MNALARIPVMIAFGLLPLALPACRWHGDKQEHSAAPSPGPPGATRARTATGLPTPPGGSANTAVGVAPGPASHMPDGRAVDIALAAGTEASPPLLMLSVSPQGETDHMGRIRTLQLDGGGAPQGEWESVVVGDFSWAGRFGTCVGAAGDLIVVTHTREAGRCVMRCIRPFSEAVVGQAVAIPQLRSLTAGEELISLVGKPPPGAPDGQPGACTLYEVDSPDLVCWAGSVYCAFSNMFANAEVAVISDPPDEPQTWTPYRALGRGGAPNLAGTSGALFVSYTSTDSWFTDFPSPGPIVLCRSGDGETWSEPKPTVDEPKAHSSALAADDDIGLVLVYTAEREDGWPLFAARSADYGETWGEPVMLSERDIRCYRPDAVMCDGRLWIAYLEVPNVPIDPNNQVVGDPTGVFTMVLDPMDLPVP